MSTTRIAGIVGASVLVAAWLIAATTTRHGNFPQAPVSSAPVVTPSNEALELADEVVRLRQRLGDAPVPRESVRNPFELTAEQFPMSTAAVDVQLGITPEPVAPSVPDMALLGMAENQTTAGTERTAIVSAMGEVLLVRVGDTVGGRLTVTAMSPNGVLLRDGDTGVERRLRLP